MAGNEIPDRIVAVLEDLDEPATPGTIQQRIVDTGLDVARSALRAALSDLVAEGKIEQVGDPPRRRYRLADGE